MPPSDTEIESATGLRALLYISVNQLAIEQYRLLPLCQRDIAFQSRSEDLTFVAGAVNPRNLIEPVRQFLEKYNIESIFIASKLLAKQYSSFIC